jgi:hypothetical protein
VEKIKTLDCILRRLEMLLKDFKQGKCMISFSFFKDHWLVGREGLEKSHRRNRRT